MEAPKKLYISNYGSEVRYNWHPERLTEKDIEYTRTDAFIKKVCETFCKVKCNDKPPRSTCTSLGTCFEHDEFRKALKGE